MFRVRYRTTSDAQRALYDSDWLVQAVDFCGHIMRKQAWNVFAISDMGERNDPFPFLDPVPDRGQPRQR